MPSLLIINPNTSDPVTALLSRQARALLPPDATVQLRTASFGAPYISSEAAVVVAGHACLQAYADHVVVHGQPDAVLIGCFGDPGLLALKELTPVPVTGLAEAAMRAGTVRGRYAIVTGGAAWAPMLRRLAWSLNLDGTLAAVVTVERSGAELAADPQAAHALLLQACRQAISQAGPAGLDCIVLGGAALSDMAGRLASALEVPLLDSVACGLHQAWEMASRPERGLPIPPCAAPIDWQGLAAPLKALAARSD